MKDKKRMKALDITAVLEKKKEPKFYMLEAVEQGCSNGDAYITMDELFFRCKKLRENLTENDFRKDLAQQVHEENLCREGNRVYLAKVFRYEESAAENLAAILRHPGFPSVELPDPLVVNGITLCDEQRAAVSAALRNRMTVIVGGAGSGKSTLIRGICDHMEGVRVLCAPTGKAARNLTARTGIEARTVHSALGRAPDEDFLAPVEWTHVRLLIVDELSMVSLEMLAGILCRANKNCRIVLLGDDKQLQSVGVGNVMFDLLALGVPTVRLEANHRQSGTAGGLLQNVVNFKDLGRMRDLVWDESFVLHTACEEETMNALIKDAVRRYQAKENVLVLAPFKNMVAKLNAMIREKVNPMFKEKKAITIGGNEFRDGDRVLITKNDREHDCSNGDVGTLRILDDSEIHPLYYVVLPDGRKPVWETDDGLRNMALAYALTIHKSQGSEYSTVLVAVFEGMERMLSRNLFYTAISRAQNSVFLYGSPEAVGTAMQKETPRRKSMLVAKTHMKSCGCA